MLTDEQQKELNDLRHESQKIKDRMSKNEVEMDTAQYEMNYLKKWKSGRSVGFFIMLIVTVAGMGIEYFYVVIQGNAMATMHRDNSAAVEFAVSSTAIIFFSMLLMVITLFTFFLGAKLMLEVGRSKMSRSLARSFGVKNYYNSIEHFKERESAINREKYELSVKKKRIDETIAELEKDEVPWYQQY